MNSRASSLLVLVVIAAAVWIGFGCGNVVSPGGYTPQPSPHIVNATDKDFESVVLAANKPVVVDFWASWCGPCAMLDPTVVKLAEEFKDRVKFVRVNVDQSPTTSRKYDVSGIPMLGLYHNGEMVDSRVGVEPENALRGWLIEKLSSMDDDA